jgi:hypothetical protein
MIKEWETEPDSEDFTYNGFVCKIFRDLDFKSLCGFVKIPSTMFYYRKNYDHECFSTILIHGGLTSSGYLRAYPGLENEKGWWIGFDCGHSIDYKPGAHTYYSKANPETMYKNFDYVRSHLKYLVDQIIEIERAKSRLGAISND